MKMGLIYDRDGTLVDNKRDVVRIYAGVLGISEKQVKQQVLPDWRRYVKEKNLPQATCLEGEKRFGELDDVLFPDAKTHLEKVIKDGYITALATSSKSSNVKLEKYGLSDIFSAVVTADDVNHIKPEPECLILAADRMNLEVIDCISIGDRVVDAVAAKRARMPFIGAGWGFDHVEAVRRVNNDPVAGNFDELYDIIRSLS